ncbi:hypothetical protein BH10BAC1_BH10BAC1_05700 [soil metagenome]
MKTNFLKLAFCILLLTSGCTKILLYTYGVRNPKIETKERITKYLDSNKLSSTECYCLKDTASLNQFYLSRIGTPEIRFYDSNGYLMIYRDNKKCNGQNDSLIGFLDPKNIIKIDSSNNIKEYINQLRTLDGKAINKDEFKNYDFYLIMYWAKYLGKVNSIKMLDWEKSLAEKSNLKIKTIKLTVDYMDFWPLSKKDMAKIYSPRVKISDEKKKREEENK